LFHLGLYNMIIAKRFEEEPIRIHFFTVL
jgi:hypothetical protein